MRSYSKTYDGELSSLVTEKWESGFGRILTETGMRGLLEVINLFHILTGLVTQLNVFVRTQISAFYCM